MMNDDATPEEVHVSQGPRTGRLWVQRYSTQASGGGDTTIKRSVCVMTDFEKKGCGQQGRGSFTQPNGEAISDKLSPDDGVT